MKITIDTKEDSAEELKKLITLLSSLVEGKRADGRDIVSNRNIFEQEEAPTSAENALANIFGADNLSADKNSAIKETKPKEGLKDDDVPSIELY